MLIVYHRTAENTYGFYKSLICRVRSDILGYRRVTLGKTCIYNQRVHVEKGLQIEVLLRIDVSDFKPTKEQKAILLAFKKKQNLRIHAFAGTGKTTTLEFLAKNTQDKGVYIAFNKRVAAEAKKKMPDNVEASTIHSIAWKWAKETYAVEKLLHSPNRTILKKQVEIPDIKGFSNYKTVTTISLILKSFCNSRDKAISAKHLPWDHISYARDKELLERQTGVLVKTAKTAWKGFVTLSPLAAFSRSC